MKAVKAKNKVLHVVYARVRAREAKSERSGFLSEVVSFTSEKNKTTSDVDETTSEKNKRSPFMPLKATPLHTFDHFQGEKAWTNRKNGGILTTFLHKNQEDEQE